MKLMYQVRITTVKRIKEEEKYIRHRVEEGQVSNFKKRKGQRLFSARSGVLEENKDTIMDNFRVIYDMILESDLETSGIKRIKTINYF